jgi:type VI secretion system protein ImpC
MPGRIDGEFRFGAHGGRRPDTPTLRIVVLADLGRRPELVPDAPGRPLAPRRLVQVDVDSFGEALARIAPRLELRLGRPDAPALPIAFGSLDDFHPDALYRRLEPFRPLREVRRRLLDTSTFGEAATEWSRLVGLVTEARLPAPPAPPSPVEDEAATRRRLLGLGSAETSPAPPAVAAGVDRLLREIVSPYIVPSADRRLPELLRSVDDAAAGLLRAILHHPDFQALEATWRSVHGLVTEVETDAGVDVRLLDVTREELQADDAAGIATLERLLTAREAVEDAGAVWPLIVAGFTFGPDREDVTLLERLGAVAGRAGGPVLAAASPALVGYRSFAETPAPGDWKPLDAAGAERWRRLRESAAGPWIGLAMPRILLRLPYGGRGDPVAAFDFEELPSGRDHESYLWGNPAFACARLMAFSFVEHGAAMEPGDRLELDDLPAALYDGEEGRVMKPCAETALGEAAAQRILDTGAMPLLASTRRNAVRVMRVQSIALPPRPLAGRWG